ncbi:MAG: HAMP domain-containing histidine kinase [Deltaproteobacteria bacterium]|nr:HAMP domain-containing histidine kinase [Deltaproteobacteria bacterium]
MKADLYGSIVSKLATVVPMFAKGIVDSALEKHGLTPDTMTPVQMMALIRDEIQPRIRKFTLQDEDVLAMGMGQVATDQDGFVVRMDPMARLLLGLPARAVSSDPEVRACILETGLRCEGEECVRPRVREFYHEPSKRMLNVGVVPRFDLEGKPAGCFAVIQDISLRAALEQEVQRYEEKLRAANRELERKTAQLEEANRHKDEFLARMSHELRTPLHCIIGYTQIALKDGGRIDDPAVRQNLRTTMTCAHDLLGLINDVFDLSRVEAGSLGVRPERVIPSEIAGECIAMTRPLLENEDIRLESDVAPDCPEIETDPLRLKQILLNLLGNAVKFTDSGEVRLEVEPAADSGVLFHVVDTGIGIPEGEQGLIFDRFYQVDGSATRRHGGAGLGLALVMHLVKILGGSVSVRSSPGKGSRFTVRLPRGRGPELVEGP